MFHFCAGRRAAALGIILLSGTLLLPGAAQQTDSKIEEHFLAAQKDQQQGLLDAAVQEYKTVLRLQPAMAEAYVNLGLVYYAQAKFDDSARALAQAARLKPGMRGVPLWLGIDQVKLRHPDRGVALLREAVRSNPADKLAQSWLGTALWDAGQMDAALLQLGKAARQFPGDLDLLQACGEAYGKAASQQAEQLLQDSAGTALSDLIYADMYAEQRDWRKAEKHLLRAMERDPHSADAHLKFAEILFRQSRLAEAKEQAGLALALAPRSAAALARDSELSILLEQPEQGLSRLATAFDIDPRQALDTLELPLEDRVGRDEVDARLKAQARAAIERLQTASSTGPAKEAALAALYALAGDDEKSRRAYGAMGAVAPRGGNATDARAQAQLALREHRYNDAEAQLLHWLAANPSDQQARYDLIRARRQISLAQLARLIEVAPDSYQAHQMLGQIYVQREEDDLAMTEYLAVAAARPDLPDVHFWLGHLYWKHGDADHALAELNRQLQLDPAHPEAHGELGGVLVARGLTAEAIPHLELAIRSKPDLWPAYVQLGRAYTMEKNYARAEEMLRRTLAHDHDAAAHYQLALVLRAEGKTAAAAELFTQVKRIKTEQMVQLSQDAAIHR